MNTDQNERTGVRWTVVALLFFATTINYIDRAVFGILGPMLGEEFKWSEVEYSRMIMAFQLTYAIGYVSAGRLLDLIGVRKGFIIIVGVWSAAAAAHGFVQFVPHGLRWVLCEGVILSVPVIMFGAARAALGLAEGGSFPASIKTVAEWFPKEQRALATGWFNAGSNAGAISCPLLVPVLVAHWGWPGAFYVTGAIGFIWMAAWWWLYRSPEGHPGVSAAELAYIRKDPPDPVTTRTPWLQLFSYRQTWAFITGMSASAPIWWFYIFWGPKFLKAQFNLNLTGSSLPLAMIFLGASFGGIGGGWLSSSLIRRGWNVNTSRKTAMLVCALCVVPVLVTPMVSNVWTAVSLIGLAAAAHCGFAANLFTLVSDTMPRQAVGSVVGIGGMASAIAAIFFAELTGRVLQAGSSYQLFFSIASVSYLTALLIMHLLMPRQEKE